MRRLRIQLTLGCLLLATAAAAQTTPVHPNFSGIWKMDAEKSDFGASEAPQSAEYVIRHLHSTLAFDYTQDGNTSRVEITPDNEERVTNETGDLQTWTRAHWSGEELVMEARQKSRNLQASAVPIKWTSRWKLSPDRKVLTIQRRITTPQGAIDQVVVFVRQPLGPRASNQ